LVSFWSVRPEWRWLKDLRDETGITPRRGMVEFHQGRRRSMETITAVCLPAKQKSTGMTIEACRRARRTSMGMMGEECLQGRRRSYFAIRTADSSTRIIALMLIVGVAGDVWYSCLGSTSSARTLCSQFPETTGSTLRLLLLRVTNMGITRGMSLRTTQQHASSATCSIWFPRRAADKRSERFDQEKFRSGVPACS
jgi:hypothetical protein